METEVKIENNSNFIETAESLGITKFKQAANVGSSFVFATDKFFPLYFDFNTNDYMLFHGKPKLKPATTCVDISDNKKYVITGHQDGSISLWSIPDNFSFIKMHQKYHSNSPIKKVKFGRNSDTFYVADSNGLITQINLTVIFTAYTFKEVVIYNSNISSLESIVVSRQGDPFPIGFLVFKDYYVTFDPSAVNNSAVNFVQQKKSSIVIFKSDQLKFQPHISLYARQQDYFLNIANGPNLRMLQVRDINNTIPLLSSVTFPGEQIKKTIFLSSSLIAILTDNGSMQLMLYNGDIIVKHHSEELINVFNSSSSFLNFDEKIVAVTEKDVNIISFANWEDMIEGMAKIGQWSNAFHSLAEINLDLSCNLIGIPTNFAIRRKRVMELGQRIFVDYFKGALKESDDDLLSDKVATAAVNIVSLELIQYMVNDIYAVFKSQDRVNPYFEGIKKAGDKNFVLFCSPKFVDNYVEYSRKKGKSAANDAENYLISLKYNMSQIISLIEVAADKNLLELVKYLYINYLNDCVSPAAFYFEAGKFVEYLDFVFSDNSDSDISRARQKSMIVWTLIPNNKGQFKRFEALCNFGLEKALYYVTLFSQFLSNSPIQFSFTDFMKIDVLILATLKVLNKVTFEKAEPFLVVLLPFISSRNIHTGNDSLKHIVQWCFGSKYKVTVRESVFRIFISDHPKLLPKEVIANLCERANFISFIKEIYLPMKSFTKIITAMIQNEEYRMLVFDFMKDHLDDRDQIKAAMFSNCRALLLSNPQKFTLFITDNFPDEYNNVIDLLRPNERLIFLTILNEINGNLEDEKKMLMFQLLLQFRPKSAEHFLSENITDMDIEKAQELSIKFKRTDCQVVIKIYLHQYKEATEQIGNEIEKELLDFIESDSNEQPNSIDELANMKDMKRCIEIINIALKLLSIITLDSKDRMTFQKTYFYFLFPMYLASKSRPNIKLSVTLMFSYFVVSSMNSISPHHAFLILSIHFSHFDEEIYKMIIKNITARIDYQKYLLKGLDEMLIADCLELIDLVYLKHTRGIKVSNLECCVCRGKLDASHYSKWYIYPCGHICHEECSKSNMLEKCPSCSGASGGYKNMGKNNAAFEDQPKKLFPKEIQRIMRRLKFALKKNFGEDVESNVATNAAFFSKTPEFEEDLIVNVDDTLPATDDFVVKVLNDK